MTKKLKASEIINIARQEYTQKKILVKASTGQEFDVLVQEKLNDTSIASLITDLLEREEFCKKRNIEFNTVENIYYLLIKYFTDIKFNTNKVLEKQYKHELDTVEALINLEIFDQIMNQFDKETLNKISNMFSKYSEQLKPLINEEVKKIIIEGE